MLMDEPGVLPFHITLPCSRAYGLLRLESQAVVLEFQLMDRWLGLLRSGVRTLHLPYLTLSGVELTKRWNGTRQLVLKAPSLHALRRVPGALQGHCWLQVQRGHRHQAEVLYSALLLKLSEYQLERLQASLPPAELPPDWNTRIKRLLGKEQR